MFHQYVPHVLKVNGDTATALEGTTMSEEGLTETALEAWITAHPEVIDESLMIVTTQFGSWASSAESASERPDILALSSTGETVVIELKRDRDRRVHLQVLTYGALVAGFTRQTLAAAHADWWATTNSGEVDIDDALQRLTNHVDGDWSEELFQLPRLVLVAAAFPAQVLTTVEWLSSVAPNLTIECHQFELAKDEDGLYATFHRISPVENLDDRLLRPAPNAAAIREQVVANTRRTRSVRVIYENKLIPDGAPLALELSSRVKPAVKDQVDKWIAQDPVRGDFTWHRDPSKPLRWGLEPDQAYTPTSLRDAVFAAAGAGKQTFSAADAWFYNGRCLYWIADDAR